MKVIHRDQSSSRLHEESIVIDGLNISVWDEDVFSRLHQGGVTAINATVACWENFRDTIRNIEQWNRLFESSSLIMPVRTISDIREAKRQRKVGIIFGFQNTTPIEDDVGLLQVFYDLGVRIIQLTFQDRNYVGDGCWEKSDAGLSEFGFRVIKEMNRQGLLIDLSHSGDMTTIQAIEASMNPVAITHANPRSLVDNRRNKLDEQIIALAEKGGVIGATLYPPLLAKGQESSLADFLDAIDYLVKLAGIDHVAIGSDFTEKQDETFFTKALTGKSWEKPFANLNFPVNYPKGISSARELPNVTNGLLERGYSEVEVRKILGENWIRLFSQVWRS